MTRKPYPSDNSDDEWAFVAPYLTLMTEDAPQREHDLPSCHTVYQQTQRWLKAGVFETLVHDLRSLLREIADRAPQPTAAVFDARTLQSTPESGARAGYDGHKHRKGSKVHLAVDTLGRLPCSCSNASPLSWFKVHNTF